MAVPSTFTLAEDLRYIQPWINATNLQQSMQTKQGHQIQYNSTIQAAEMRCLRSKAAHNLITNIEIRQGLGLEKSIKEQICE